MSSVYVDEKQLRRIMIDKDIKTINELAQKSGVSKPTIYDYINGKSPMSEAFLRLCNYLEIKPSEILVEE
jgi:DNA-binding Xre family transcriptional regulator